MDRGPKKANIGFFFLHSWHLGMAAVSLFYLVYIFIVILHNWTCSKRCSM
jgi:hypothetical protein